MKLFALLIILNKGIMHVIRNAWKGGQTYTATDFQLKDFELGSSSIIFATNSIPFKTFSIYFKTSQLGESHLGLWML